MNLPAELSRVPPDRAIMQTEESTPPTSSPRVRIIWLVGVHVLVGLLLGAITAAM